MRHIAQETDFSLKKIYLSLSEKREFFIFYFIIQKKKDLRMENLRFLNICLSAFFWQIDNDTITVNRIKKGSNKNGRQEKIEKGKSLLWM